MLDLNQRSKTLQILYKKCYELLFNELTYFGPCFLRKNALKKTPISPMSLWVDLWAKIG